MAVYMFMLNAKTRSNIDSRGDSLLFYVSHGMDAGLVGYLVASVFFTVLFYPLFWVQLSLTIALNRISKTKEGG